MTSLYVVMINDRHTDPEPFLFISKDNAIAYANEFACESASNPIYLEENDIEGFMYHITYSTEGDAAWVIEKKILDKDSGE